MTSKPQDVAKHNISPVLFMTVDGKPMSFFLRPGPAKRKLQPLITAGGGMSCNVQQPGAILLIDPEERSSITETTAHWYVSTKYIHDCVEKDEQLNLEDYRLDPKVVPTRHSARLSNNKESSPGHLGGRVAYSPEEDAAILSYVSKHQKEVKGNRLWQEMEKQRVTCHSWQSMKYRYRIRLAQRLSEVVDVATTEEEAKAAEGETKVEGNEETDAEKGNEETDAEKGNEETDAEKGNEETDAEKENEETDAEKPCSAEDAVSPLTHSAELDQTQIDAQCIPAESTQPETVEAQTSASPQGKVQQVNPQTDKQPAESTQVEILGAETSPQPEEPCLDPQADAHPIPAESKETETDEPQTNVSPQKESASEVSPRAQAKSLLDNSPQKKQKASPRLEQPQRRLTRRQLQLEEASSPQHGGKKLRSSSSDSAEQSSSSPQSSRKTKSAVRSTPQKDTAVDQPPSKKAKGKSAAATVAESQQEENEQTVTSETTQADTESRSEPQRGEKKKEKRKLGILELAAKEFEDESESDDDEAPDLRNPAEATTVLPTSTEPLLPAPVPTTPTQSSPEQGHQESGQDIQDSNSNCPPPAGCTDAVVTEVRAAEPAATEAAAVSAASKAHLFIFDSESQVEESQSIINENTAATANPQQTVNKAAAFSLTQDELEENKQRITELMKETNQDLVSVTKALLRTSGDFSVARDLLLDPSSVSGPFWRRSDDALLLSGDPVIQQQLQEKYGEENVAKRIIFLEV